MKFLRTERVHTRPRLTPRRLAAARRSIHRELAAVPLFPELVQTTRPEDRIAERDAEFARHWQRIRDFRAATWRRCRAEIRTLPLARKTQVLAHWQAGIYPADPGYLADLLHTLSRHPDHITEYWSQLDRVKAIATASRQEAA